MTRPPIDAFPTSHEPAVDPAAIADLRALQDDGEDGLLAELIALFLEDAALRLERLWDALGRGDAEVVEREAHALKGASGNFGARPLAGFCDRLQKAGRENALSDAPALLAGLEAELVRVREALTAELARGEE